MSCKNIGSAIAPIIRVSFSSVYEFRHLLHPVYLVVNIEPLAFLLSVGLF